MYQGNESKKVVLYENQSEITPVYQTYYRLLLKQSHKHYITWQEQCITVLFHWITTP